MFVLHRKQLVSATKINQLLLFKGKNYVYSAPGLENRDYGRGDPLR
jgi:hypothetical protein